MPLCHRAEAQSCTKKLGEAEGPVHLLAGAASPLDPGKGVVEVPRGSSRLVWQTAIPGFDYLGNPRGRQGILPNRHDHQVMSGSVVQRRSLHRFDVILDEGLKVRDAI